MSFAYQIHQKVTVRERLWRSPDLAENLELREVAKPTPGPNEALVRIKAVSLNARDLMIVAHDPVYPLMPNSGISPCCDGAGVVESTGPGSTWKAGDRVVLNTCNWVHGTDIRDLDLKTALGTLDVNGTLRQYAVVKDDGIARFPDYLSFEEAATTPTAPKSAAYALLFGPEPLKKGMTVLTQGTGGVSCGAIQIASALGATVIATSSSDQKLEEAKRLGATHTINYVKTPEWDQEVRRLTDGKGVDHVVEVSGPSTIRRSIKSTRVGGQVSIVGMLSEPKGENIIGDLLIGSVTLRGILSGSGDMLKRLFEVMEEHKIKPLIGKVFEWEDAKEAFKHYVSNEDPGKIVIRV